MKYSNRALSILMLFSGTAALLYLLLYRDYFVNYPIPNLLVFTFAVFSYISESGYWLIISFLLTVLIYVGAVAVWKKRIVLSAIGALLYAVDLATVIFLTSTDGYMDTSFILSGIVDIVVIALFIPVLVQWVKGKKQSRQIIPS